MRGIYLVVGFLLICFSVLAQSADDKKKMSEANDRFEMHDYFGAEKLLMDLHKTNPEDKDLNYKLGVCAYELKKYELAEEYLIKSSSTASLEIFKYKAYVAHALKKFTKAINFYNAYKIIRGDKELTNEKVNQLIAKSKYAQTVFKAPRNVEIENLGQTINTKYDEYVPLITADEKMMVFTSRRDGNGNTKDPNGRYFENIYQTTKENGVWQKPTFLNKSINTSTNDASAGLSADGTLMYIFRTNEDLMSGDLYESRMGLDDWETPKKLGGQINSKYIETSASVTPSERTLYFSSDRPGGLGGKDIYKVERLPNGTWGKPQNLGPTVNTENDEDAPFIHSDGRTLYFSSTGHQNMGGYDIFKTELNEDNVWMNPENIGYPINTVTDDIFFVLAADGKSGYYSSAREGGYGGQDIYKVNLKDEYEKLHVLKANVLDKKTKNPLVAKITLIENESASIQGIYKSKAANGSFIMLVKPDKTYSYVIQSDGYYPKTEELDFDITSNKETKFLLEAK